jgi:hypothetical protein
MVTVNHQHHAQNFHASFLLCVRTLICSSRFFSNDEIMYLAFFCVNTVSLSAIEQFSIQKTNSEFSRRISNSAGESPIQQMKSAFSGTRCARARASRAALDLLMTPTTKFRIRPCRRATIRLIVFTASSCCSYVHTFWCTGILTRGIALRSSKWGVENEAHGGGAPEAPNVQSRE